MIKDYYKCKRCKHKCLESEIFNKPIKFCPLCHLALVLQNQKVQNDIDIID